MIKSKSIIVLLLISSFILIMACQKLLPPSPKEEEILAGTIPGLTSQQEKEHLVGDEAFGKIFGEKDGLGPVFVQTSCSNCHLGNGKGHLSTIVKRFAKINGLLVDYLINKGGPQLQPHSISGYSAENIPTEATVITKRLPPVVMGLGYIAALHDQAILANVDSNDANGDGIYGRPNYVTPTSFFTAQDIHLENNGKYIGRFGKKAEKITILDQVVFALKQDIGITSDFDVEDLYNAEVGNHTGDNVADPEVSSGFVNSIVFYMRTLKAPQRRNANAPDVLEGEKLFSQMGCVSCHVPTFTTSQSDISALSNQIFHPYSDFLLHDMGSGLDDGYPEGSANSNEWRTPPLWGIGLAKDSQGGQKFLLHDGRAATFEDAISFHGGEAASRRAAFFNLSEQQKQQVIKFLESL